MTIRSMYWRSLLRCAVTTTPLIATVGFIWFQHINAPPVVHVPTSTLPSPNAVDMLILADSQLVGRNDIGFAVATRQVPGQRVFTSDEKATLVAENATALATIQRALTRPYQNRAVRKLNQPLTELARFRGLARLLSIQGQVREAKGDYAGAA